MDDSTYTQSSDMTPQKKTLSESATDALSGAKNWFTGLFSKPEQTDATIETEPENVSVGGNKKRSLHRRIRSKKMKGGKVTSRTHTHNGKKCTIQHNKHRSTKTMSKRRGSTHKRRRM